MPVLPNPKHEKFAWAIATGSTSREAYKAAGYETKSAAAADACASRLLHNAKVSSRVAEIKDGVDARKIEKTAVTKAWVVAKLVENFERAMQAEAVRDKDGNPIGDYTYNGSVANRALELLGKEQGMFIDKKEVGKPGDFQHLDDAALDAEIKRMVSADPEMATLLKARAPRGATKH